MKLPLTKRELAIKYNVSYNTFKNWINNIPELTLMPNQRLLTPKQISIIINHLGAPPNST